MSSDLSQGPAQRAGTVRVLGVRHHGPGSARAVVSALDELRPVTVLIEGPPEADRLVAWVGDPDLRPPVALLAYANDQPRRAALWPLATFSPEWQALVWARRHGAEVRFMDLPAANVLAIDDETDVEPDLFDQDRGEAEGGEHADGAARVREDPIAVLARTAGYDDPERWWDDVIEHRLDGDPFDALTEAMAELREGNDMAELREGHIETLHERRREAHMRKVLRASLKDSAGPVAVVCGAWHAPALSGKLPPQAADTKLLRGLPKKKVTVTWVPWTHSRLAFRSGYGAGVESPGWYHHLFTEPDQPVTRWLTKIAAELRANDMPVSSAHIIEAVRLAEALAALRDRPLAGLAEVNEATWSVMCDGNRLALDLVTRNVVVGELLGTVPEAAPHVPLEADLRATARRLRLKFEPEGKDVVLDLRKDNDREKSHLLQRLTVLGIGWGHPLATSSIGTFKEGWRLAWLPDFAVNLVEASLWGTTVVDAASAKLVDGIDSLAQAAQRVEVALRAGLTQTLPRLLRTLDACAARDQDVSHLMAAYPALVRARRYGDVRGTDTTALAGVIEAMLPRICAGLAAAVGGLDDEAADQLRVHIDGVQAVMNLVGSEDARDLWQQTLLALTGRSDLNAAMSGRLVRIVLDIGLIDRDDAARRLSRALSLGTPPADQAGWIEGFLAGGALLLVHDEQLLSVLDEWVGELSEDDFVDVVPMLRRTFGAFAKAERGNVAERVKVLRSGGRRVREAERLDVTAAAGVLRTVGMLIGAGRE